MSTETVSYSVAIEQLKAIVERIESGNIDVDDLASSVQEATRLITLCRDKLRATQTEVEKALASMDEGRTSAPAPQVESSLSPANESDSLLSELQLKAK